MSDADRRLDGVDPRPGTAAWWNERHSLASRRRPRSDGLSLDRILAAALRVLDEEGLEALTMRHLADELGAGPASLYRHVANREELLVELVDHVLGDIRPPPHPSTWRQGARWLSGEVHRLLVEHPSLIVLVPGDRLLGPNANRGRELGLRNLLDRGFGPEDAAHVYGMVLGWVLGCATLLSSVTMRTGDGLRAVHGVISRDATARAVEAFTAAGVTTLFDDGLETLMDGIEARYVIAPPTP